MNKKCTNNPLDAEKNKFVGTWKGTETNNAIGVSGETIVIFFSDGTYQMGAFSEAWDIKDRKLVCSFDSTYQMVFTYQFSSGDRTLSLDCIGVNTSMALTKQ